MTDATRWPIRFARGTTEDERRILAIEREAFQYPWTVADYRRTVQTVGTITRVAVDGRGLGGFPAALAPPVGFIVYRLGKPPVEILDLAVDFLARREGVATALLRDLFARQPRRPIVARVRESNLPAQLLFASVGFRCTVQTPAAYTEIGEDCLTFEREAAGRCAI